MLRNAAMETIDRLDRHILVRLQANGRLTNAALAEAIALSPSACLARVRRLEREGVITGYSARLAIDRLRPSLVIYGEVTLKRHLPEDFRALDALFERDPRVLEAAEISGRSDYFVKVIVADMTEWRELSGRWTAGPWQIERVTSQVAMHRTKEFTGYPLAGPDARPAGGR
jgi:DNA-binding Lrp family transcriptional regulator